VNNVLSIPLSGGTVTPMNWLASSETITACSVSGTGNFSERERGGEGEGKKR
jgi:hypothetical protein